MATTVYVLGALTTLLCAILLLRAYLRVGRQAAAVERALLRRAHRLERTALHRPDRDRRPSCRFTRGGSPPPPPRWRCCSMASSGKENNHARRLPARRHRHLLARRRGVLPQVLEAHARSALPGLRRGLSDRGAEPDRLSCSSSTRTRGSPAIYAVRLLAFLLILAAIVRKNRSA